MLIRPRVHAAGLDVKFTAEVKDNFSLLAAFSATSPSKVDEKTDPGTKSKTTFGAEGKIGLEKLKDKIPKPLQGLLPSADLSAKFNEEINVEGQTTKHTETTAARNPSGSYQVDLLQNIPAAPAPAGGSPGPTNVSNIYQQTDSSIHVRDVTINPPALEKPVPEKPQPTTTIKHSPSIQAGREGEANPDLEKVYAFTEGVQRDVRAAWDDLHVSSAQRTGRPIIYVTGHASKTGDVKTNRRISKERAQKVKAFLVNDLEFHEDCVKAMGASDFAAKRAGARPEERYVEIELHYQGKTYSYPLTSGGPG